MERFLTKGVCAAAIDFDVQDGIIQTVVFHGGCSGNLTGISKLVQGMSAENAISTLKGIKCGSKPTSCPDQLTIALDNWMKANEAGK